MSVDEKRIQARFELDLLPDFTVVGKTVSLRREFRTLTANETFCAVPDVVVERAKTLLTCPLIDTVARTVHDRVFFELGCSRVLLFALLVGGRNRTMFSFRCVFDRCSAFLDVRLFSGVYTVKWVLMSLSHSHGFATFPRRMPRATFSSATLARFAEAVEQNKTCAEIIMENNVLCNKHVFQNAVRSCRGDKKREQTRELRDAAHFSTLWNSELHLTSENVYEEMFFVNRHLISKGLSVDLVFVDDTSCTNTFSLPLISTLCRSECGSVHTVAWGFLKNRTTKSFERFFAFLHKHHPGISVFVCDRNNAQSRAIATVFGGGVHIISCCVHIARNIARSMGPIRRSCRSFGGCGLNAALSRRRRSWRTSRGRTEQRRRCSRRGF